MDPLVKYTQPTSSHWKTKRSRLWPSASHEKIATNLQYMIDSATAAQNGWWNTMAPLSIAAMGTLKNPIRQLLEPIVDLNVHVDAVAGVYLPMFQNAS